MGLPISDKSSLQAYTPTGFDKIVASSVILLFLMYPTICQMVFRLFTCLEAGGDFYTQADPEITCLTGKHKQAVLAAGIPAMTGFVVGLPLASAVVLFKNRQNLDAPRFKSVFGILHS